MEEEPSQAWGELDTSQPMEITPDPVVLYSMANQRLSFGVAAGEFIDNGVDHDAKRIEFQKDKEREVLLYLDNGTGIQHLDAMVKLGAHKPKNGKKTIGMYGIGFKEAASSFRGQTHVRTWRKAVGQERSQMIDWDAIAKSGVWKCTEPPKIYSVPKDRKWLSGVEIQVPMTMARMRRINDHYETLAFRYTPAIQQGLEIAFMHVGPGKPHYLEAYTPPPFKYELPEITVPCGVGQIRVMGGVIAASDNNQFSGVHLVYRRRVIKPGTNNGCGSTPISRLFVWVELLGDGWAVTKHKTDVSEEHEAVVDQALEPVLAPILKQAEAESQQTTMPIYSKALTAMFKEATEKTNEDDLDSDEEELVEGKEQRDSNPPAPQPGTVKPTNAGGKRLHPAKIQLGTNLLAQSKKLSKGITVELGNTGASHPTVRANLDGALVTLNRENAQVQSMLNSKSQEVHICGIGAMIIGAIAAELKADQLSMFDAPADPGQRFSMLLDYFLPLLREQWVKHRQ
ncbi:MAG: ATP-binding protein [Candidatus Krumholzibacteria bacterium]|nr:ATP-binding protein [Candidatus Krumholzibacteria bacterium]